MEKRRIELAVISDVHLGTYGCQAKALCRYLKSIDPEKLILNGDIIDIWQFNKHYWPKSHMKVLQCIFKMLGNGTRVYYLTGNHDEMLRKFTDFSMGHLQIVNKLVLELDGKKAWFFHGDVFDVTMKHSRWLAKLGGFGYDLLILINSLVNWCSRKMGRGPVSLSKKIKNSVKQAVQFVSDFEQTAVRIALEKEYDYVICGHIHQPSIKKIMQGSRVTTYLNSGDWIENLTSLEYDKGAWRLFHFQEEMANETEREEEESATHYNIKDLYENIVRDTRHG